MDSCTISNNLQDNMVSDICPQNREVQRDVVHFFFPSSSAVLAARTSLLWAAASKVGDKCQLVTEILRADRHGFMKSIVKSAIQVTGRCSLVILHCRVSHYNIRHLISFVCADLLHLHRSPLDSTVRFQIRLLFYDGASDVAR